MVSIIYGEESKLSKYVPLALFIKEIFYTVAIKLCDEMVTTLSR